jgi:hypothetical protein
MARPIQQQRPEPKLSDLKKLPLRAIERKLLELHRSQGLPADEVAADLKMTPLRVRELYASIVQRHNLRILEIANQSKIDRFKPSSRSRRTTASNAGEGCMMSNKLAESLESQWATEQESALREYARIIKDPKPTPETTLAMRGLMRVLGKTIKDVASDQAAYLEFMRLRDDSNDQGPAGERQRAADDAYRAAVETHKEDYKKADAKKQAAAAAQIQARSRYSHCIACTKRIRELVKAHDIFDDGDLLSEEQAHSLAQAREAAKTLNRPRDDAALLKPVEGHGALIREAAELE